MERSTDERGDPSPTELFGLLANGTRMAAMRALWKSDQPLSFSELAEQGGIHDTGNFSYHLGKLQPNFVRKVDDRYALTRAGQLVLTAVLAGRFTEHPAFEPTEVDRHCPLCGEPLALEHGDETLRASCTACPGLYRDRSGDERITKLWLPPAGVREDPTATLEAAFQWTYSRNWSFALGTCPECSGRVETRARVCSDHGSSGGLCDVCDGRYGVLARHRCLTCHATVSVLPIVPMQTDHRLRSFFLAHGPDPVEFSFRSIGALVPYEEAILNRDPLLFELRIERGDESLTVSANDRLETIDIDRSER